MVTMVQHMKEESENPGKQHDDDGIIYYDAEENVLGDDEYFHGFDDNEDATSKYYKDYMDALNNLTGSRDDVSQFLIGEDWYQYLYKDDEDYTILLMV